MTDRWTPGDSSSPRSLRRPVSDVIFIGPARAGTVGEPHNTRRGHALQGWPTQPKRPRHQQLTLPLQPDHWLFEADRKSLPSRQSFEGLYPRPEI